MFVTICKFGVVPLGQLVPSAKQTCLLLINVSEGKRVKPVTRKAVPVAAPQKRSEVVAELRVSRPVKRPVPTTSKVDDGLVVPTPT